MGPYDRATGLVKMSSWSDLLIRERMRPCHTIARMMVNVYRMVALTSFLAGGGFQSLA